MVDRLDRETLRETIVESNSSVAKAGGDFIFWSNAGWTWDAEYTSADRGVNTKPHMVLQTFRGGSGMEVSPGLSVEGTCAVRILSIEGASITGVSVDLTFNYHFY